MCLLCPFNPLSLCFISSQINCHGKVLCFFFVITLLRVTRTLWKYFPMVTPRPHWKMRQIDSPSPLENPIPSVGGGVWIFSGTTHFEDINISFFSHNLQHHFLIELYLSFQLLFTMAKNHLEFCFACITTVS